MINNFSLYVLIACIALIISLVFTPIARAFAVKLSILDHPTSHVKTHKDPTPYLGGVAIFLAFALSLICARFFTSFPTGTLRSLRGLLCGGALICILGLIDDIKVQGLHYKTKFLMQISAACMLMLFGIRIRFVHPEWLAAIITVIWVVGVTNAFNLIDIMDGLSSGVATVTSLSFLLIALPKEELYVNFAAAAMAGAALGFLPFNLSKRKKIFMGDTGSLLLGFTASALAMGTSYSSNTRLGVLAPLVILAVPIYDTLLVFYLRLGRGHSPFLGSKDHFALRLEFLGWRRRWILVVTVLISGFFGLGAWCVTRADTATALLIYGAICLSLAVFTGYLLKAEIR